MQIRIFTFSANTTEEEQERMNKFLRSHRILEVKQQYDETRGQWSFSVSYLDGEAPASIQLASSAFSMPSYKAKSPELFPDITKVS